MEADAFSYLTLAQEKRKQRLELEAKRERGRESSKNDWSAKHAWSVKQEGKQKD